MKSEETQITIRMLTADESPSLASLAGRDSAPVPTGQVVGASVDGRLVAAQSITTGESIADPFLRTAAARAMLAERVEHLRGGRNAGRHPRLRLLLRRRRSNRRQRTARPQAVRTGGPPGPADRMLFVPPKAY
jgi:hypothetical protein